MKAIVLDLETSVQSVGGELDGSPYNPDNFCVSAHWRVIDELGQIGEAQRLIWNHAEKDAPDPRQPLQDALNECGELVAHNAKFDVQWLLEMEFDLPERVWCTMIGEYILARGQWLGLSLKDTAERRRVTRKRSDVTEEYFKKGIGFDQMPLDVMIEYADADVLSAAEIYLAQRDDLQAENNKGLRPVFDLMFDMLHFLVEIEQNGIKIDLDALSEVEDQFRAEKQEIERRLNEIVGEVMGDTPINLNSGPDMTAVVYSRRVTDRELHKQMFNIGVNAVGKPLPTPRMNKSEFAAAVRATTSVVEKTVAQCCPDCAGSGKQRKFRKDGQPYKRQPKCKVCDGHGVIYAKTGEKAGLRLVPEGPADASVFQGWSFGSPENCPATARLSRTSSTAKISTGKPLPSSTSATFRRSLRRCGKPLRPIVLLHYMVDRELTNHRIYNSTSKSSLTSTRVWRESTASGWTAY